MFNTPTKDLFARFIQFVEQEHANANGPLTISDLRQAIRLDRLTEISVWSYQELDDVEAESLAFDEEKVLSYIDAVCV